MDTSYIFTGRLYFGSNEIQELVAEIEKLKTLPVPDLEKRITQRRVEILPAPGTWKYNIGYYTQSPEETILCLHHEEFSRTYIQSL